MSKTFGTESVDFSRPPEECRFCNFKYSHKYTVQDHVFTKKHIDMVRRFPKMIIMKCKNGDKI